MPDQTTFVLLNTLSYFFRALELFLILYIILSWLPIKPNNVFVQFIRTVTEPMLIPIRKLLRKSVLGGRASVVDFSPIIVFIILTFLQSTVERLLRG